MGLVYVTVLSKMYVDLCDMQFNLKSRIMGSAYVARMDIAASNMFRQTSHSGEYFSLEKKYENTTDTFPACHIKYLVSPGVLLALVMQECLDP